MSIHDLSTEEFMDLPKLKLDDTFEFNCISCGRCCKNRHDILLTPYDLYRISSHLGRTPQEVFERYCEVYEGRNSHYPVVRIVPVPPTNSCPFLRGKRCSVHARKPVVCRVYPLARIFDEQPEAYYVISGASCHHHPHPISVREWIADVASEEAEQAGSLWSEAVHAILPEIQPGKIPEALRERCLSTAFSTLWLNYDMSKSFIAQFRDNITHIKEIIPKYTDADSAALLP
jgi:Fe-S-cluster containining protein